MPGHRFGRLRRPRVADPGRQALAVLEPYCSVCDVSYVPGGPAGAPGVGTTFVCAPGRLDGAPAAGAPQGEIVAWEPPRVVTTRLRPTPGTWTTRIELAGTGDGGTRATMTVTHEPIGGSRVGSCGTSSAVPCGAWCSGPWTRSWPRSPPTSTGSPTPLERR